VRRYGTRKWAVSIDRNSTLTALFCFYRLKRARQALIICYCWFFGPFCISFFVSTIIPSYLFRNASVWFNCSWGLQQAIICFIPTESYVILIVFVSVLLLGPSGGLYEDDDHGGGNHNNLLYKTIKQRDNIMSLFSLFFYLFWHKLFDDCCVCAALVACQMSCSLFIHWIHPCLQTSAISTINPSAGCVPNIVSFVDSWDTYRSNFGWIIYILLTTKNYPKLHF